MSFSIQGLGLRPLGVHPPEADGSTRPSIDAHGPPGQPDRARQRQSAEQGVAGSTSAADVDSGLWELLSDDERRFYVRHAMAGPLTYGPRARQGPSTSGGRLGGRLDVMA